MVCRLLALVFVLFLVQVQGTGAQCCARQVREPCVAPPRGCFDQVVSGVATCGGSEALCACGTCGGCGECGGCYRDAAAPCACACDGCAAKSVLYFPMVEYPQTCLEMNPFYFANCFRY